MPDSTRTTAIVMAGGRFSGGDADAAGTEIKALAEIGGVTLIERVLQALRSVETVGQVVVVGPTDVARHAGEYNCSHQFEAGSLWGNVQAGMAAAGVSLDENVLLTGSDLPALKAKSIADFLERSPADAQVTVPLVSRAAYDSAFPGSPSTYVPLKDGSYTIGSQFLVSAALLNDPPTRIIDLLSRRKSQWQMARTLGVPILFGLLTHTLTITQLEHRASNLLRAKAAAVPNCAPDLAFDIDDARDLAYARLMK